MTDSHQLLADYCQHGSDAVFRELVSRFVGLVYSTALRLVGGDTHQAEDVTQTVFVDLARQARTLPADVRLGGWLHRHTCFVAAHIARGERRRQARERQAVEMNALQTHPEADFSQVAPLLDEAINELADADRTAILLRFFEQQDFRAVGAALGSTEDAARMRVTRALEKLEEFLKRRGVKTTAASLGVVLAAKVIQAVPMGLTTTISTAAALAGTALAATATATAPKAIVMTTMQKIAVTGALTAAVGVGIYQAKEAHDARVEVRTLRQQQAPLVEQVQRLKGEKDTTAMRLLTLASTLERARTNSSELLKLRAEVTRLRSEAEALAAEAMEARAAQTDMLQVLSNLPPVRKFVSTTAAAASWGQTIVTGGWKLPGGRRAIILVQPYPGNANNQITLRSTILEYSEDAGEKLGLTQFNFDEHALDGTVARATAHTINVEQSEAVLNTAKSTEGVNVLEAPGVSTISGRQAQIQAVDIHALPSGQRYPTGPVIDFIPTISHDGEGIELVMTAQLDYPVQPARK